MAFAVELFLDPRVPALMRRERGEVLRLEVFDEFDVNLSLIGESPRLAAIVSSMANFLTHESSGVMSIEGLLGEGFVASIVACPSKVGPDQTSNSSV